MPIDILAISADTTVLLTTLPESTESAIQEAEAVITTSIAWVVPPKIREDLAQLSGVIDDRGVKHPSIELSRTMLRGDGHRIAMIDGQFSSSGKLLNSVQKLLKNAVKVSRKLFIIGVSDDIFNELLKTARSENFQPATLAIPFSGRSGAVLNLMERIPEPASLKAAFIGDSADAVAVRQLILRAAQVDNTVLIMGDTGTGKEIVARNIHENSSRRNKPFRAVNCAAFPHDLLESELFGHVRGAFTGALTTNEGLWLAADGGTLFLDEIGELTQAHQAKLLRALQENCIRKVGGTSETSVNARVICATNHNLLSMVQAGHFREDLYYRLRGFLIITPPLCEHPDDIPLLARVFWNDITRDDKAFLPDDIVVALRNYAWPGNVRELKMVLTHLFGLFHTVHPLDVRHLQAVFEIQGLHLHPVLIETASAAETRPRGFPSFRHLWRVYETIRAVDHLLSPILNVKGRNMPHLSHISTGVINLLNEINMHSRTPCLFSPQTFENISRLCSRLAYFFSEFEKSPEKALDYLRDGTRGVIDEALTDLLAEIDQTLTGAL
jgi:transcriptional regulator with AAA-type ATPase domain